jgi:predicted CoA-binding protein
VSIEADVLKSYRIVAVVGLSPDQARDSYRVAEYLREHGYSVIPVNPMAPEVMGEKCYPDLMSVPGKVEVVDIFRRASDVPPIVEQAIKIGAKAVWMQEGVVNNVAAARAREAGLTVVMDRCMRKEHVQLRGSTSGKSPITQAI